MGSVVLFKGSVEGNETPNAGGEGVSFEGTPYSLGCYVSSVIGGDSDHEGNSSIFVSLVKLVTKRKHEKVNSLESHLYTQQNSSSLDLLKIQRDIKYLYIKYFY